MCLCAIYVGFSTVFKGQQYIVMLALVIFMLLALSIELVVKPYKQQSLNFLSIASSVAIIGLLFSELLITVETMVGNGGISITKAVALVFVLFPHLAFYFFILKEFQAEVTLWCYFKSTRLFTLVTFGLVNRIKYGKKFGNIQEKKEESL